MSILCRILCPNVFTLPWSILALAALSAPVLHSAPPSKTDRAKYWDFAIIKIESADITKHDYSYNHQNIAKWMITTELVNKSDRARLLLAVPLYGAVAADFGETLPIEADRHVFLSASHLPIRNKETDFISIPPGGKLVSTHLVFARRDSSGTSYTLFGFFVRHENEPPELKSNNFATQWLLRKSPVGDEFSIAITLVSNEGDDFERILGKDYRAFWQGSLRSSPATIKALGKINWSREAEGTATPQK
jgi:hypothetical protein